MSESGSPSTRVLRITLPAILLVVLAGCTTQPEVTGEVLDGFARPLPGATVKIENTTFVTATGEDGRYAVGYVPGKVVVTISKEGYTSASLTLDIATEAKYPAQSVTLYEQPTQKGIFAFGASSYLPLGKGKLAFNSKQVSFSWDKPLFEESYTVIGDFTIIDASKEFLFLDNDGRNQQLLAVGPQDVILQRTKTFMKTRDNAKVLSEESTKIAPNLWLRRVTLTTGRYSFVTTGPLAEMGIGGIGAGGPPGPNGHPIVEPVYLFEVK